jgi:membrane fusion protein (multidrug efflux system)
MPASMNVESSTIAVRTVRRAARALLATALAALLVACGKPGGAPGAPGAGPGGPGGAPPPPEVGVVTVRSQPVALSNELSGRVEALRTAQVRARAAGILKKRLFVEGSEVKAGQQLFLIDSAPYQAALASAQATLARAQANLAQAAAQAQRYKPLVEAHAVSEQEYVNAVAAQKQGEADVAAGKAAVQTAQINLSYATVVAPISGRIGRALVTEGALVGQGEATPLATIQQVDPTYVNFTQSTTEVLQLRRDFASGKLKHANGPNAASVRLVLEDGSVYPQPGRLLFTDLTVDPTSGQVTLRAEVPNPGVMLLPGMYVRVRVEQAEAADGILLPQQAVQRGAAGDSVMVVAPDGKVSPRPIKVGTAVGGQWVVLGGLQPGEMVMVDGFQKLRGNAPVKPVPWQAPAASGPAMATVQPRGGATAAALPSPAASRAVTAASR